MTSNNMLWCDEWTTKPMFLQDQHCLVPLIHKLDNSRHAIGGNMPKICDCVSFVVVVSRKHTLLCSEHTQIRNNDSYYCFYPWIYLDMEVVFYCDAHNLPNFPTLLLSFPCMLDLHWQTIIRSLLRHAFVEF